MTNCGSWVFRFEGCPDEEDDEEEEDDPEEVLLYNALRFRGDGVLVLFSINGSIDCPLEGVVLTDGDKKEMNNRNREDGQMGRNLTR